MPSNFFFQVGLLMTWRSMLFLCCCKWSYVCKFYGQKESTLNENGNSQVKYIWFLFSYLHMKLNVGLHKTKPKNVKVKNSDLIQMTCSLICTIPFLCFMEIFPSLKFDPIYMCVCRYIYNNGNKKLFQW